MTNGVRIHKDFSPSKAERLELCPGAYNLLKRTPLRERTVYADEGDVAHAVVEAGLNTYSTTAEQAIENSIYCFEEFTVDFIAAIQEALDYVWLRLETIQAQYGDAVLYTETYVDPPVSAAPGEAGGYCDIGIFSALARTLWVIDYKHGVGVVKDAIGNMQALQYGGGFLFGQPALIPPESVDKVIVVIIQPRAFHPGGSIREAEYTPLQVSDYLMRLDENIENALKADAPLKPGLEQCQFCEARSVCPALEANALRVINPAISNIQQVNNLTLPDPKTLDVHRLSYIKKSFDMLRMWMNSVDTHIDELERSGIDVPGYKLVASDARREWYGDEEQRIAKLSNLIGCDKGELYRKSLKPLTEVEKMVVQAFKDRVGRSRKKQAAEDAKQMFAYFTLIG